MQYGLVRTVEPAEEPVSLTEAKAFLRVEIPDDDVLLATLIKDARDRCERVTGLQLVTATWRLTLDCFPLDTSHPLAGESRVLTGSAWLALGSSAVPLKMRTPPLQSVTSIVYVDSAGASQTWSAANYVVDTGRTPGEIVPTYGQVWPTTRDQPNAITITYVAGYGLASAVPAAIKVRLMQALKHGYDMDDPDEAYLDRLFVSLDYGNYR